MVYTSFNNCVNSFKSLEKHCATNVAPAVKAISNGFKDGSIDPPGGDFSF